MIKKIFACFTALILIGLAGCGADQNNTTSPEQTSEINGITDNPAQVSFTAHYIRTDGYNDGVKYPLATVIKSKKELDDYYLLNKEKYYLEKRAAVPPNTSGGFLDYADNYGDDYFADHTLLLVLLEESSGSNRHEVTKIAQNETATEITIRRDVPEIGTADMAEWHIFIELKNTEYNGSEIKVIFS